MFSLKNILAGGPGRTSKSPDVFEACAPETSGVFFGLQPLGLMVGRVQGHDHEETIRAANWVDTVDGTSTLATAEGYPSTLVLTTQATANTGVNAQISKDGGTTAWARFKPTAGYNIYFEALVKLSDANLSALALGFAPVDTTLLDGTSTLGGNTAFLGFFKATGDTEMVGVLRNASTSTSIDLKSAAGSETDLANDTYVALGMRVNGVTSVEFFVNGFVTHQATVTNLPSVDLALSIALDAGAAAIKSGTFRRIVAFQEAA